MYRFLLLPILLLTTVALADTVDFAGGGSIADHDAGTIGQLKVGSTFSMFDQLQEINDETTHNVQQGDLGKVVITTGALSNGTISQSNGTVFLNANDNGGGTVAIKNKNGVFSSDSIVNTSTVPEPSALWLLGSGLVGLSFVRRFLH
jgi:hypothetical protein